VLAATAIKGDPLFPFEIELEEPGIAARECNSDDLMCWNRVAQQTRASAKIDAVCWLVAEEEAQQRDGRQCWGDPVDGEKLTQVVPDCGGQFGHPIRQARTRDRIKYARRMERDSQGFRSQRCAIQARYYQRQRRRGVHVELVF
jgi:hypothetical protein